MAILFKWWLVLTTADHCGHVPACTNIFEIPFICTYMQLDMKVYVYLHCNYSFAAFQITGYPIR